MLKRAYVSVLVCLFIIVRHAEAQKSLFINGDKVCFIGDSHTMSGSYGYFINLFYATRFPLNNIRFYNSGISGDVSAGVLRRLDSDVFIHDPTWCTLLIGGNDINEELYTDAYKDEPGIKERQQDALNNYYRYSDSLIRRLLAKNIKVILVTVPPYDETAEIPTPVIHGLNAMSKQLALNWEAEGRKYSLPVVNIWTILDELNGRIQAKDSSATIIGRDRVHVSRLGNFVMSYQFLKTLGASGIVSIIDIDAGKAKLIKEVNCKITRLVAKQNFISFSCLTKALPFPSEPGFNVDSLVPFTKELNNESLRIRGLAPGKYELYIDDVMAGIFSGEELESGINLANDRTTPQYRQSDSVRTLVDSYWKTVADMRAIRFVEYEHLRAFQNKNDFSQVKAYLTGRLEKFKAEGSDNYDFFTKMYTKYFMNKPREKDLEDQLVRNLDTIHETAVPRKHAYKIVRVKDNHQQQ